MRKTIWDKRIPTILGIILITIGIGVTSYLVGQGVIIIGKASPSETPQDVRITNVMDNSFTVSYRTDANVVGSINYGKDSAFGQNGLDERDQKSGAITAHKIHSITVRNLSPSTKYFFSILSGQKTYLNTETPFGITTGSPIESEPTKQEPIAGKVLLPDGSNPKEAIIYLTSENAQVVSTLIAPDGSYILPLNSIRTASLSAYLNFSPDAILKALYIGDSLTSNVVLSIKQASPVPIITLSKDYDFTSAENPEASPSAQTQQSLPSFTSTTETGGTTPKITTPKENEGFTDEKPLFRGTAQPNEKVEIIIRSTEIKAETTSDTNGNWSFRPSSVLSPGEHTISIITKDASGIVRTITQKFTVYAAGSQVSQPATPSATLTPSPTPTPIIIPTVSPTPTSSATPTLIPTVTPTPTIIVTPSPTPTLPPPPDTGSDTVTFAVILGIATTLAGIIFFLLGRGSISL